MYVGLFETNSAPPRASFISSIDPADFTNAILFRISSKIIAEEIIKLQKSHSGTVVNNFYYNFNGDVLDAEKLVRMLKLKEHLMAFRMAG
ncbi:hypothetical protein QIA45_05035 (plasmid) [Borreliella andersonii]|uniref:Uncharacterized protein n=2 Tax=Borrelia andersonii TaxID=42109 RepID=A0ACD5G638_BORAD